ncbi:CPBP family intramembrane metalloprotease [Enterococcus hulanensis]|uniref:CPBP family intramembrane glutamic endopeptidase n=1 Tax=Enterococcus hulanensis TaxID=2559929 RepID=UPI001A8DBC40|nr:type II CAAX endopeptidase family protein [Enterococcus hulanensis]MBO0457469.1 CPBP family intramembrane metalloprotease [Enterococcus hulanensis]
MASNKKHWWGLFIIPLELLIGDCLFPLLHLGKSPETALLASTLLFLTGFVATIYLFHDFLREQWHLYRSRLFLRLLMSIFLTAVAFLLLRVTREMIPSELLQLRASTNPSPQTLNPSWTVLAAIIPFIAPFTEELTFRYLLLGKFSSKFLRVIMLFIQGILFGLIHWTTFNGNVYAMIPYMVLGVYLGLIYLLSKNIWGSIMVHWMFNTMNSMLPALLLLVLNLLGITT